MIYDSLVRIKINEVWTCSKEKNYVIYDMDYNMKKGKGEKGILRIEESVDRLILYATIWYIVSVWLSLGIHKSTYAMFHI